MSTSIIPITLTPGSLPAGYNDNPQEYYEAICSLTKATMDVSPFLLGQIGGAQPGINVGPWLKNLKEWWVWDSLSATYVPMSNELEIGDIAMTAKNNVDKNHWLICDGKEYTRNQPYDKLFTAIGTSYGAGDGSTTFKVPNFGSRVPIGVGLGQDSDNKDLTRYAPFTKGGLELVQLEEKHTPPHTHVISAYHQANETNQTPVRLIADDDYAPLRSSSETTESVNSNEAGDNLAEPHNNMPPWFSCVFKIKYQ